jgi:hypothetical protein
MVQTSTISLFLSSFYIFNMAKQEDIFKNVISRTLFSVKENTMV